MTRKKSTMKNRLIVFAVALMLGLVGWAQSTKTLPSLHVEGKWLVDTYGNHVVLHGCMDTPSMWFNGSIVQRNLGHLNISQAT